MGFELFLVKRQMARKKRASIMCILGVCVGVAALIVVLSVFSGFQSQLKSVMVSVHPHIRIDQWGGMTDPEGEIEKVKAMKLPGLKHVSSFIAAEAVMQSEQGAGALGVLVRGVDEKHDTENIFSQKMIAGLYDLSDKVEIRTKKRLFFFKEISQEIYGSVVIGQGLARSLQISMGDTVTILAPNLGASGSLSLQSIKARRFIVRGIFYLGMNEFDNNFVLTSIPRAQDLYSLGNKVNGLSLRFEDVDQALTHVWAIRGQLGQGYSVSTWHDVNPHFFQALKVEKSVQTIFLGLIVLVAAFNIFSTLVMIVMEKTKDIGILRALGATAGHVRNVFLIQGALMGTLGVILGTVLGVTVLIYRNNLLDFVKETTGYELFPSSVYLFDGLPAEIHPEDIAWIAGLALICSIIAAIYPAIRAARLSPVEALRYE